MKRYVALLHKVGGQPFDETRGAWFSTDYKTILAPADDALLAPLSAPWLQAALADGWAFECFLELAEAPARLTRDANVAEEVGRIVGMFDAVCGDFNVEHIFTASMEFAVWNMVSRARMLNVPQGSLAPWVENVLHLVRRAFFSNWERQRQETDVVVKPN